MTRTRFTEKFKEEAVRQVTDSGFAVPDLVNRLGALAKRLYKWLRPANTMCTPALEIAFSCLA